MLESSHPLQLARYTLLLATFGVPAAAAQDSGIITGYVRAFGTEAPLAAAQVRLLTTDVVVETNGDGYYVLRGVPAGRHTLLVQAIGYQPTIRRNNAVLGGTLTTVDFELRSTTYQLDPIRVTGREEVDATVTSAVSVLTGDDIPPEGDIILGLQGRVPGLSISFPAGAIRSPARTDGVIVTGRLNRPFMWVLDGVAYPGAPNFYVDAGNVECVEVRQGSNEVAKYARAGHAPHRFAGVILVWTKFGSLRREGGCVSPGGSDPDLR